MGELVHPPTVPSTGLALYRTPRFPGTFALVHHRSHEDAKNGVVASVLIIPAMAEEQRVWAQQQEPSWSTVRGLCPFSALHVKVSLRHFQDAVRNLTPSVPMEELRRYAQLATEYQ